ncbi:hypothetical protein N7489_001656 [Penicillium chrysogenum]|uniref:uncharacterized protein n=1 Tax=Penicillium chrysogenum TaxID=5076 RepID=UPI0023A68C8E|nr:uncharacterized protein N7489_001656 [Penicillium chrysogenum]KAJ5251246.1 hypothetical protein N7489_001656 [Penicillium chrysogenum]KAJ5262679.1 hypothetical protein N7524_007984 [Penicillium chrysogenum]KAJ6147117.1 hypothetical protein N7497_009099 [Penicillium chrysogenum]
MFIFTALVSHGEITTEISPCNTRHRPSSTRPVFLRGYIPGDELYSCMNSMSIPPESHRSRVKYAPWTGDRAKSGNNLIYERMGAVPRSSKMSRFVKEFGIYTSLFGFAEHT